MAKKSAIEKNKKRKNIVDKYYAKRLELKRIERSKELTPEERRANRLKLEALPRNASPIRFRNRCNNTGKPRGVFRKFNLCRTQLRDLAGQGVLPGVIKSSW